MQTTSTPMTVLLVDDHAQFVAMLRDYLGQFQRLRVTAVAASGEQAVALAEMHAPDIVFIDLDMPGIGGIEATRILKTLPRKPQVVVLTLHDEVRFRRAALEAGADSFIVKDRLHDELPSLVERMVRTLRP